MQTIDAHAMLDALALFDAPAVVEVPAGIVAARRAPPILPRDMQSLVELTLRHNQPLTSPRREELSPLYQLAGGVAPWGNQRASSHRRRPCRRGLPRRTHP